MTRFIPVPWRWRRADLLTATAAAVSIGMIVTAAVMLLAPLSQGGAAAASAEHPVDLTGKPVQVDGPSPVPSTSATPDGIGRFAAPSVGLDVPLGAVNVVANVFEPPGFTSAYWVRNLGVAPADSTRGTVFVVMHSLRHGGVAPGNVLIDVADGTARIAQGADIVVAGLRYRVERTEVLPKTQISHDAEVWQNTPRRLVVITCLQRPDGQPSTANMVIEATLAA